MEFDALDHVGLLVPDTDRSIEWYEPAGARLLPQAGSRSLYVDDPDLHLVENHDL